MVQPPSTPASAGANAAPESPETTGATPANVPGAATLDWQPALTRPDLLAPVTAAALAAWLDASPNITDHVLVAPIDPDVSDTAAMSDAYGIPMHASVNCVLVAGRREGQERTAAVAVRATTRADINGAVRRMLAVRKASFVPVDRAVADSSMEYGGITPIGLSPRWRVVLDAAVATDPNWVVIGSGVRRSKLVLPGTVLAQFPDMRTLAGLALS